MEGENENRPNPPDPAAPTPGGEFTCPECGSTIDPESRELRQSGGRLGEALREADYWRSRDVQNQTVIADLNRKIEDLNRRAPAPTPADRGRKDFVLYDR